MFNREIIIISSGYGKFCKNGHKNLQQLLRYVTSEFVCVYFKSTLIGFSIIAELSGESELFFF